MAVLGFLAWFWLDSLRAREIATAITTQWCKKHGAQLLDQTVSLSNIRWVRNTRLPGHWLRHYRFFYAIGGTDRRRGHIDMLGMQMHAFDWGDGKSIFEAAVGGQPPGD